ncbi:GIY-YIG nuclease family protein [Candidatus Parcubacteria bacterium]|nr:GIY-YIG nuclease family protein [Candidatus Parcubacteria bacterium]
MYYVYLLKCKELGTKIFYIGCSSDLRKRIGQHKNNEVKTTKGREPKLIYYEAFNNKYLAYEREKGLKSSGSVYNALLRRLKIK